MTKVGFILPPTVGVLRGSRVCSTSVTTTRLVAVKLRGLNHHHERNRLAPPCCDEYRIAPLQSGMLVCKRADRRVHRIPFGSTRIGHVLAIALCALLIGYKLRQQRLHRGRQVVGVGLGLRHQGFGDREVEGAFSSRRSACLHFENPKQRNANIMLIEFETANFLPLSPSITAALSRCRPNSVSKAKSRKS